MKKSSPCLAISCVFLVLNSLYLIFFCVFPGFKWLFPQNVLFTPFAKMWFQIYQAVLSLGFNGINTLLGFLVLWPIVTVIGIFRLRTWAYRSLLYMLVSIIIWGAFYPVTVNKSANIMSLYLSRTNNAFVYDAYHQPLFNNYKIMLGQPASRPDYRMTQYEPFFLKQRRYDQDPDKTVKEIVSAFELRKYKAYNDNEIPSAEEVARRLELNPWYGGYWALMLMAKNEFSTTAALNDVILFLFEVILTLWCIVIPAFLIYFLHAPGVKALMGVPLLAQEKERKRVHVLLFAGLVISLAILLRTVIS